MLKFTVAHNCNGKAKNLPAKTKYLTVKPKTSRQKQNTSRQNRKPHGKNKNLTAKPKTSRQKQILHSKNQIPHGKSKYPRQNQSYFVFAVKYLVLPWGFWFCREVFCFCREVFGFAVRYFVFSVRFLVWQWCFGFCREVFGFAVTVVGQNKKFDLLPLHLIYSSTLWLKRPTGNSGNQIQVYCSLFKFAGCSTLPFSRHFAHYL